MVNAETVDVVEITVLPCAGIDVEIHVNGIALMQVELLDTIGAKDAEKTRTRILILGLNHKLLRLPGVVGALGNAFFGRILLNDYSFYFYSL